MLKNDVKETIHYITYYIEPDYKDILSGSMAVLPKVDYVNSCLLDDGYKTNIISTASAQPKVRWFSRKRKINSNNKVLTFSSFGSNYKTIRFLSRFWIKIQLFLYLIFEVKQNDIILIYHSLQYLWLYRIIKLIKKNRIILQVEEIYSHAYKQFNKYLTAELELLGIADSYICINEYVEQLIAGSKPSCILYGDYRSNINNTPKTNKTDKTHIVYAGVIESTRNAAITAVNAAKYLTDDYVVHIAGFGDDLDIKELKTQIDRVNLDLGYTGVQYDGAFRGKEFDDYLYTKDIGLNSHTYTEDELISADVTFPSKIIIYLNHGLKVVSPKINCLTNSAISKHIDFYDGFNPEELAKTIVESKKKDRNPQEIFEFISQLDIDFKENIKKLFNPY